MSCLVFQNALNQKLNWKTCVLGLNLQCFQFTVNVPVGSLAGVGDRWPWETDAGVWFLMARPASQRSNHVL